ncbi:MAG: gliding motility-associated C-terminal domain-containing protein [Bacteroidia bacterium]
MSPSSFVIADGLGDGSDGSPNISGVINTYSPVFSITPSPCSSSITVLSAAGFAAGDLVLIIQMENATINTTNTASYGTIINYNNSGNFEYAKIFSVAGTVIQTVAPLGNSYDILGVVQLVKVPQYISPTITGIITCPAWNGLTGGIIALDATGTITMSADIDASGKGFRGGLYQPCFDIGIHVGDYLALNQPDTFSLKGEGIATYTLASFISGRGACANGGGGGGSHNAGGGGGSNAGCGGNGGYGYTDAAYGVNYASAQGSGGYALSNAGVSFKVFMGGGGGAGNADNLSNSSGGNGGGIILITTNNLTGNSKFIKTSGATAADGIIDGVGGGGAGGTVVFDCATINSSVKIDANGGNGGNINAFNNVNPHGPGGGGGGGLAVFTSASLPANVTINSISGGSAGLCDVSANGSLNGCPGATKFNLVLPQQLSNPTTTSAKDTVFCNNGLLTLTATTGSIYSWSPAAGLSCTNCQAPAATVNVTTVYIATVNFSSCIYIDSFTVQINSLPNVTLANLNSVCIDASSFAVSGGAPAGGIYSGTGVSANNFDPSVAGVGSHPITYSYSDANNCDNTATKNITVNALPTVTLSPINSVCIASQTFALSTGTPAGGTYSGVGVTGNNFDPAVAGSGNHKVYYSYADVNGCSNIDSTIVTVYDIPQVTFTPVNPVCDGTAAFTLNGGAPSGGTYSGAGIVGTDFNPVIAGIGTHTITYSFTDPQGCSNSATTDIIVNALPNVTLSNFNSVCVNEATFALSGGIPAGGAYTGTGVSANNFDPVVAGIGAYPITYSYTNANGCSNAKTKNITVHSLPTVTLSSINSVCIASPAFALTTGTPAGGTYSGVGVTGNNFDPVGAGIGTQQVYYTFTDGNVCSNVDSTTLTVYDIPQVTFTSVNPVCDGASSFMLTGGSPAGGTYSGVGVSGNDFDPAIAGIGTQTITYSYTDAQGCSNSLITDITVNALPNVTLSNFSSVCVDAASFSLSGGMPSGGTYSGTGVITNNFDPATAGVGSYPVTYSYTDANGCSNTKTKNITVNSLPTVSLSPISSVCIAAPTFALITGTPLGGIYSGIGVTGNNFDPVAAGTGTQQVYYTFTDGNGCSNVDSTTLTVYDIPQVTFTSVNPVCDGASAFMLAGGSPAGGTYSGVGVSGNDFDPAVAGIGTQTIAYFYTDVQGCSNSTTIDIIVNALPNVTLSNFNSVCVDGSSFALSGGSPIGGIYSGSGVSANNFDPSIAGVGLTQITYFYTDGNGCSNAKTKNLIVNALPVVTLSGISSVCIASPAFSLSNGTPAGGTYSGVGVSGGNFTPIVAGIGTHKIYYFYTDANGCSGIDSNTITVYNIPIITFTPGNSICDGTPAFALTNASPAGGTYSGVGVSGNVFDPAVAGIGIQTLTYSYTDVQGCSNSATINITVNALPNVTLSNFNAVCVDASSFILNGGTPAGGTYTGAGVNANNFDPATAGVGTHAITYNYTDANGCSDVAAKNIIVNALPAVILSTINPVCIASSSFTLTAGIPSGGTYSGVGVNAGNFTPFVAGIGIHKIYYFYSDANGCSGSDSTTITVYNIPQVTFTTVNPVCDGTPVFTLTSGSPAGGIYSGAGVVGNNFDPTIAGIGTHNITYSFTDPQGCSNSITTNIIVNPLPIVTLSNFNSVCVNASSFALNGGSPVGGLYSGAGVNANNFNPASAGVGTHAIAYSYTDANGCSKSVTKNIIVNPLPAVNLSAINPVCIASSAFVLTTGTPVGGIYSGAGISSGIFSPSIAGIGTHKIFYFYSDANGCSNIDSTILTVYNIPQVTFTPWNPVCNGSPSFALSGGLPSGGTYSGIGVIGNNFDPAIPGIGTQNITYHYTDGNGCSNSTTSAITVNALPNVTLLNFNSVCQNTPSFPLSGGAPIGGSYSGAGVSGNNFYPASAGTGTHAIVYSYTDSNSCSNTAAKNLIVNPLIFLNAGSDQTICSGYSVQLNASGTSNILWTPSTGLNCTYCTGPIANPISTTTYVVSSSLPCSSNDTVTVNVVPAVVVDAGRDTMLCFGETVQLIASSNYSSYSWNAINDLSCFNCPDPVSSPSETSVYTITSTNGICSSTDTVLIKVIKVEVTAGNDATIVFGESIELNASGANSYLWSPGLYLNDSTLQSPIASPYSTTQYIVTGNIDRCSAIDSVTIEIIYIGDAVFVPNSFTPNGDGKNDLFGAVHAGKYDSFDMKIFNRWGEMVFNSNNISEFWDGTYKGLKQTAGVYAYHISLVSGENRILKIGNVTLLR